MFLLRTILLSLFVVAQITFLALAYCSLKQSQATNELLKKVILQNGLSQIHWNLNGLEQNDPILIQKIKNDILIPPNRHQTLSLKKILQKTMKVDNMVKYPGLRRFWDSPKVIQNLDFSSKLELQMGNGFQTLCTLKGIMGGLVCWLNLIRTCFLTWSKLTGINHRLISEN